MRTVDDGLSEKDGFIQEDWIVFLCFLPPQTSSLPNSTLLFPAFCYILQHIFWIVQPLSISWTTLLYISRSISACQIILYVIFFCSSSQTISHPLQVLSYLSLSLSPPILLLCMLALLYSLCLFLFSLIPPPGLSLKQLCVEYKLHCERILCDIAFTLFTVINMPFLSCMCLFPACQHLIDIISIYRHSSLHSTYISTDQWQWRHFIHI